MNFSSVKILKAKGATHFKRGLVILIGTFLWIKNCEPSVKVYFIVPPYYFL